MIIVFILIISIIVFLYFSSKDLKENSITWNIDGENSELLPNSGLSSIQKIEEKGGVLKKHDQIVIWAQMFLDHDVFYETVKENIQDGIRYFYILDRKYIGLFKELLEKLYIDLGNSQLVHNSIDVIFIKGELTLNNYALLAPKTNRELLYSSLIYKERPVGWFRQSTMRSSIFQQKVLKLLKNIAETQGQQDIGNQYKDYDGGFFFLQDQIMNYSVALKHLDNEGNLPNFPSMQSYLKPARLTNRSKSRLKIVTTNIKKENEKKQINLNK